jgi:hypothetical protein
MIRLNNLHVSNHEYYRRIAFFFIITACRKNELGHFSLFSGDLYIRQMDKFTDTLKAGADKFTSGVKLGTDKMRDLIPNQSTTEHKENVQSTSQSSTVEVGTAVEVTSKYL